jgi:hypothetical protein
MSCTDGAGNSGSASKAFQYDATAPTNIATGLNRAADLNGWYNRSVGWTTTGSDGTSGIASCDAGSYSGPDGTGLTVTGRCTDKAGNSSASVPSAAFKYDSTPPTNITFTGITAKTYAVSDLPTGSSIGCAAGDVTSGLAACAVASFSSEFGSHTLTATATDNAGNQQTATLTYIVGIQSGNILPPLTAPAGDQGNPTATDLQVFKIKSVLPVKFQMYMDAARTKLMTTPPTGSVAKLTFVKHDNTTDSNDTTADLITGSANTDNLYRWTGSPDYQYIYNLSTSGKTAGTYGVYITLYAADGTTVLAQSATQYFVLRT